MFVKRIICLIVFPLLLVACGSSPSYEGIAPAEMSKLTAMGINAEQAREYQEMGFTSSTIQTWYDQGITLQQNIIVWHDARFTAAEAGAWTTAGFTPKDAHEWRKKNFAASDGKLWRDAGYKLKDAAKKRNKGLTP